jgi:hypothetical protein
VKQMKRFYCRKEVKQNWTFEKLALHFRTNRATIQYHMRKR